MGLVGRQLLSGMQVEKTHAEEFNLRREPSRSSAQEATGPRGDYTGHRSLCTDVHYQKRALCLPSGADAQQQSYSDVDPIRAKEANIPTRDAITAKSLITRPTSHHGTIAHFRRRPLARRLGAAGNSASMSARCSSGEKGSTSSTANTSATEL